MHRFMSSAFMILTQAWSLADLAIPPLVMADRLEVASSASAARPAHESGVFVDLQERRIAWDGEAYTFEEFATHYGLSSALGLWQKSECLDSAEQPVSITGGHPVDSAARPVDMIASRPDGQEVCFSWDELEAMTRSQGCGGKAANTDD